MPDNAVANKDTDPDQQQYQQKYRAGGAIKKCGIEVRAFALYDGAYDRYQRAEKYNIRYDDHEQAGNERQALSGK